MTNDNDLILQAILGVGAQQPNTTMDLGQGTQLPGMQTPLQQNTNYATTQQRFFSGQPSIFGRTFPQSPPRHTIGTNALQSNMGLDQQAIMQNLGLGGRS